MSAKTEEIHLNHHFSRFVFPFMIEDREKEPFEKRFCKRLMSEMDDVKDGNKHNCWQIRQDKKSPQILPHVHAFFYSKNEKPSDRYVFSYSARKKSWPFISKFLDFEFRDFSSRIKVNQIDLYIFRSGVGALIFEMELLQVFEDGEEKVSRPPAMHDLEQFNCFISKRSRSVELKKYDEGANGTDCEDGESLQLDELISSFLEEPFGKRGEDWAPLGLDLIGFTYLFLQGKDCDGNTVPVDDQTISESLFTLRRFTDRKHKPTRSQLQLEDNYEIIQTYENIFFGLSSHGWAVIAWDNDAMFFKDKQFASALRKGYFLLFLLGLHHSMAVQRLERAFLTLGGGSTQKGFFRKRRGRARVRELKDWTERYLGRSFFAHISPNQTYTEVFFKWSNLVNTENIQKKMAFIGDLEKKLENAQAQYQSHLLFSLNILVIPLSMSYMAVNLYHKLVPEGENGILAAATALMAYTIVWISRRK